MLMNNDSTSKLDIKSTWSKVATLTKLKVFFTIKSFLLSRVKIETKGFAKL